MNDQTEPTSPPGDEPTAHDAVLKQRDFERRRRLMKLGAGVLPVTLTLASRPVRAWNCNTASAWGSAQINPNASVNARNSNSAVNDNSWTTSNWINNTSGQGLGKPWPVLISYCGASGSILNSYTMGKLFGTSGPFPVTSLSTIPGTLSPPAASAPLSKDTLVIDAMKAGDQFLLYMIVARLNQMLLPSTVGACLVSAGSQDQLKLMLDGLYSPPNLPSMVWLKADIIKYLQQNFIVAS
jgi:hypothetical protein